ncbi:fibrocystin-L-like [Protopterus annectens]|uniref:fibrocystin-L-like n=1 Tax=Protopterus annectens TaxID=7888 RepID=UPI001CF99C7E|nr:fibrocystin-L-like [Protopterus annectens]
MVSDAQNVVLQNNVVAGFERAGYRIDGEPCPDQYNPVEAWYNNEAHSGLYGIYMNQDGFPTCSHIQGFTLWKCWDYGIYFQVMSSMKISNVTLADNGMGIFSIVYTPDCLSHEISNKTIAIKNALLVGSSPDFNCSDILTNSDNNIALSNQHRSTRPPQGGRSGICWPTFASGHNLAPGHPNAGLMTYPAISGLMTVKNSVFVGYRNVCSSETNVMFMTNPANDDLQHPIHVDTLQLVNSTERAKVFIHRPDLSKVNPSDCVDMECDGKKKNIIKDLDGSFLGTIGTVIPQAEYQWNGDKRYGIGDYRIPKLLLTRLNGSRIPVAEIAPYKGILRDSNCTYISEWEAYKCFSLSYDMLVIESLDSDTETRRLSPVALLAGRYIDLLNGPQDHGWCNGYTCQKRVSLFHGIVAMNQSYQLFFTSTSPQNLRLMLLNVNDDETVLVSIFYSTLQRLDVYVNNSLVAPKNAQWNNQHTDYTLSEPAYPGQYIPQLNSTVAGENYFDRDYQMLYILVKGSTPVVIKTTAVLIIGFTIPGMTVDMFFDKDKLISNLAIVLKVPPKKIRITKIISANSSRRKRAVSTGITVQVQISEPPVLQVSNSNTTNTTDPLQYGSLMNISQTIGKLAINGNLSALGFNISSLSLVNPVPPSDNPAWNQTAAATSDQRTTTTTGSFVAPVNSLQVVIQPVAGLAGSPLIQQPCVQAVDATGICVAVDAAGMTLTAVLLNSSNLPVEGLSGTTTVAFSGCWANFTNLVLNATGDHYQLRFELNQIQIMSKSFEAKIASNSTDVTSTDNTTVSSTIAKSADSTTATPTTNPNTSTTVQSTVKSAASSFNDMAYIPYLGCIFGCMNRGGHLFAAAVITLVLIMNNVSG